jgi:type II secretory ATPase GspE/PulE/Tfp pilus assembly ATPase PilB-like protein
VEAARAPWPALGVLLVRDGVVTADELEQVLAAQDSDDRLSSRRLGELLVEREIVTNAQVARLVAEQHELPFIDLYDPDAAVPLADHLTEETARLYSALPIRRFPDGSLLVVVADPTIAGVYDDLQREIGVPVRLAVAAPDAIASEIDAAAEAERFRAPEAVEAIEPSLVFIADFVEPPLTTDVEYDGHLGSSRPPVIGSLLLRDGLITREELERALAQQRLTSTRRLGEILVQRGSLSERQLAQALAEQHELPFVDLETRTVDRIAAARLPLRLAREYCALPVETLPDGTLVVAVADPTSTLQTSELREALDRPFELAVAAPGAIEAAIAALDDEPEPSLVWAFEVPNEDAPAPESFEFAPEPDLDSPVAELGEEPEAMVTTDEDPTAETPVLESSETDFELAPALTVVDDEPEVPVADELSTDEPPAPEPEDIAPEPESEPASAAFEEEFEATVAPDVLPFGEQSAPEPEDIEPEPATAEAEDELAATVTTEEFPFEEPAAPEPEDVEPEPEPATAEVEDEVEDELEGTVTTEEFPIEEPAEPIEPELEFDDTGVELTVLTGGQLDPTTELVSEVEAALALGASAVHLVTHSDCVLVRARVDGALTDLTMLESVEPTAFRELAARRQTTFTVDGRSVEVRTTVLPTVLGDRVTFSVVNGIAAAASFDELFPSGETAETVRAALHAKRGLVVLCGSTTAERSAVLYAALHEAVQPARSVASVEDPVEQLVAGADQVEVEPRSGLTFAVGVHTALRSDADVVAVGELTDAETLRLATLGARDRCVVVTLAADTAAAGVRRLLELGGEPGTLAEALECVVAGRSVPTLCLECRTSAYATLEELTLLGRPPEESGRRLVARAAGCDACNGDGYAHSVRIAETLPLIEDVRHVVAAGATAEEIERAAVEAGMRTLTDAVVEACLEGVTASDEVARLTKRPW